MSSVCAEDVNNETYLSANDNEVNINNMQVYTSDLSNFSSNNKSNISYAQGNYSNLSDAIEESSMVYLTGNVTLNDSELVMYFDGIDISKNLTIDGQGYSINGSNFNRNFFVNSGSTLILKNLVLTNGWELNGGNIYLENSTNLELENVTFKDNNGTFGGCIFSYYENCNISIKNSLFINNNAMYGGSVYFQNGKLEIMNSTFMNSFAEIFGGAISTENSNVTIMSTVFKDCIALNSTGGGIYSRDSNLTLIGSNFTNCYGQIGGGISQLSENLNINNCNFLDNEAKYYGGGIYNIYARLNITESIFKSNNGTNGGVLYVDNATHLFLVSNDFINNSASYGGVIFSYRNDGIVNISNNFTNNHAKEGDDFYDYTIPVATIMNQFNKIISTNYTLFNGTIPYSYDLRDYGLVSSVKNQLDGGNCWAFAGLAALESCLLKATNKTYDLSEDNIKNIKAFYSLYQVKDYLSIAYPNRGGNFEMLQGYLTAWLGPVNESTEPYDDYSTVSSVLNNIMNIQNILSIKRTNYTDNDGIKLALLNYGAVSTNIFINISYFSDDDYNYYYNGSDMNTDKLNHDVCIVGWDDNYSKYNFKITPPGDGAFIIKNSWGSDWGDNGYFYVSYYDTSLALINQYLSITFILNDSTPYYKNYQYDYSCKSGWLLTNSSSSWYSVEYNSTGNDNLKAFSTYFQEPTDYTVYIYRNNQSICNQSGYSNSGYYTIQLNKNIYLNKDDSFKIVLNIKTNTTADIPIQQSILTRYIPGTGLSYFSIDGVNWNDLATYTTNITDHNYTGQVACLKAFTIAVNNFTIISPFIGGLPGSNQTVKVNVTDLYNNPVSNGTLTLIIGDKNYTSQVINGTALVNITLPEVLGVFNITYVFNNGSETSIVNSTLNVNNSCILTCNNLTKIYGETTNLTGNLCDAFSNPIINKLIALNLTRLSDGASKTYFVTTDDKGDYQLEINLYPGKYSVSGSFDGLNINNTIYIASGLVNSSILVNRIDTNLTANKFQAKYGAGQNFTGKLLNSKGEAISGQLISLNLTRLSDGASKVYMVSTNDEGDYELAINLYEGEYTAQCSYSSTVIYESSNTSTSINVTV